MDPPSAPPFPFVVGCMRSGTTLLRAMLDSHPQLSVPDESFFVVALLKRRREFEGGPNQFDGARFESALWDSQHFRNWGLDRVKVAHVLRRAAPTSVAGALRAVFAYQADARGKSRYADKTPLYVIHLLMLATAFPEARFVHLIRDGRDVALSAVATDFGPRSVGEAALLWKKRVQRGRAAGSSLGADRYLEVRFEHLVADPDGTLRRLCEFISLDFDPAMLRYYETAAHLVATMVHPQHHQELFRPPTADRPDWRTRMSAADVRLFEAIAGDLLDDLGYGRSTRPDSSTRARVALAHLSAARRSARYRAARLRGRLLRR